MSNFGVGRYVRKNLGKWNVTSQEMWDKVGRSLITKKVQMSLMDVPFNPIFYISILKSVNNKKSLIHILKFLEID